MRRADGFSYDPRGYDELVPPLTSEGCRTIVPYLRGYGPTRFLSADTMRSGEQAAVGNDLKEPSIPLRLVGRSAACRPQGVHCPVAVNCSPCHGARSRTPARHSTCGIPARLSAPSSMR